MTFGEKLQRLRKEKGWTQEELASQISISRQALSKWELGTAIPDTENVLQISKIFGVSTDYLLNDDYESDTDIPAVHSTTEKPTKKYKIIRGACIAGIGVAGSVAICMIDCSPALKWLSVFCIFVVVVVALVSLICENTKAKSNQTYG